MSGTHGTIGRGSKERRFLKNDQTGSSILQRKLLDGREKDTTHIFETSRKYSPTTSSSIQPFRTSNRETSDTLTDEGYNTINTTIRYVAINKLLLSTYVSTTILSLGH